MADRKAIRRRIYSPLQTHNHMFTPFRPDLKLKAKELRKNMTEPEKKLWFQYLRCSKAKFLRQKPIENYIVDFYCASKNLVIELDGDSHFLTEETIKKDQNRDKFLREKHSLKVLRFLNSEVIKNFEEVCDEIERNLR